mgnify:CR=1 FL=1
MTDKQRAAKVLELLAERYPDLETHLMAESPWELLVATVLAAQCTDKRVNQVTPELFRRWPDPAALAQATIPELEEVIHSVGFYHSKAKHLIAAAQLVVKEFNGETPNTMKDLIKLPGVARKTANVVLGNAFGVPGFPVDTHVIRVTGRLRWRSDWASPSPDPVAIEREVPACFPPEEWTDLSHRLILHGRAICHARKPDCADCPLNDTCPSAFAA